MNIVNKLTWRHLCLNKKRTAITIIGVIISVAMVTGVLTLGVSFLDTMKRDTIAGEGYWHALYRNVTLEQLAIIEQDENTKELVVSQDMGYARLSHVENRNKPYLFLRQYNEQGFHNFPLTVTAGRLPQKEGEIVLSNAVVDQGKMEYQIGDSIELQLGQRYRNSSNDPNEPSVVLDQSCNIAWNADGVAEEEFVPVTSKQFTVTGFIDSPSWEMEWSPGYTCLTFLDVKHLQTEELVNAATVFKNVNNKAAKQAEKLANDLGVGKEFSLNTMLLSYDGVVANDVLRSTLYGLMMIILVIIIVGSVSLIYNAFAISVSERARHLGMLSSVGATSRQKRNSVFFEGAVIGLFSIPVGIVCGVLGIRITFAFINSIMQDVLNLLVDFQAILTIPALCAAIVISILTIFISSYIPAIKASRISPIDAIKQSQDIKLTSKAVKTSQLTRKLFGMEGDIALKNLKRNKRRYKATVFSLVVSMVLFLSVSYFGEGLRQAVAMSQDGLHYDLMVLVSDNGSGEVDSNDEAVAAFTKLEGITEVADYIRFYSFSQDESKQPTVIISAMDDVSLKQYAKEIGADYEKLMDPDQFTAIGIDPVVYRDEQTNKYVEGHVLPIEKGESWPLNYTIYEENSDGTQEREVIPFVEVKVDYMTEKLPFGLHNKLPKDQGLLLVSRPVMDKIYNSNTEAKEYIGLSREVYINCSDPKGFQEKVEALENNDLYVFNVYKQKQSERQMMLLVGVFVYGFIILITAVGIANIFNTISTSIALRKREFAMLKSVGMTPGAFRKMIRYESLFYGMKAILYGVPISLLIMAVLYKTYVRNFDFGFHIPWLFVLGAALAVLLIVSLAMAYSSKKLKNESIIDGLTMENI